MANHHARLYGLALAVVVFFLAWAVVAAHPWTTAAADPRLKRLGAREAELRREAILVRKIVATRWSHYRVQLKVRRAEIARVAASNAAAQQAALAAAAAPTSSPGVQVVSLPAHVITRTS